MLAYPDNTSPTGASSARAGDSRSIWIHSDPNQAMPEGITRDASIESHRLPGRFIHLLC